MTKLSTRQSEIQAIEGLTIQIFDSQGNVAPPGTPGLPAYQFKKKLKGTATVVQYRARLQAAYPGYTCDVLDEKGEAAHGNTQLKKLRK